MLRIRGSVNLAQSLKSMDHSRFLLLSTQMYSSMLSRLHLAQQVGEELADNMDTVRFVLKLLHFLHAFSLLSLLHDPTLPITSLPCIAR